MTEDPRHPAHRHAIAQTPRASLIQLSAVQRLGLAGLLIALLWGAVAWAVRP